MKIQDCDLLERVKWITDAVASQDLGVGSLTAYLIRNGNIHATDGRMVVGTPFPFDGPDVLVPAEEFERVLVNRPPGDFTWERDLDRLILRRGRFKGRIKTLPLDTWVLPTDLPIGLTTLPDEFIPAMVALLPFVSENATKPWATCVGLVGKYAYASNNIAIARVPLGMGEGTEYLLPRWVVEFVVRRADGLASWACDTQRVTFLWEDGSWMRSQLIETTYPPVQSVLDKYFVDVPDVEITKEWRDTLRRIGKVTGDPVVRLRAEDMCGVSGEVLSVEDGVGTPCPNGYTETVWDLRYLDAVLNVATHWNPRSYPQPAPWIGDGIHGIIAGRRD